MTGWYPLAVLYHGNDAGGYDTAYPYRGVLHTTEGTSAQGAFNAYRQHNSWPHFTVDQIGNVYQHITIDLAARSLENQSGGVETNRAGAIQIEVVGYASTPNWPLAQMGGVSLLMTWIMAQTGIKPLDLVFGGNEQAGYHNPLQLSPADWRAFNGWCGHQHVPENAHWDPGAINLKLLLPEDPVTIPKVNAPVTGICASYDPATGDIKGYMMVGADGGLFRFGEGVPDLGRVEYVLPPGNDWTPAA